MIIKTKELSGTALDWAVAQARGEYTFIANGQLEAMWTPNGYSPSTKWDQAASVINNHINTMERDCYAGWFARTQEGYESTGETVLIAVMRAYVTSWLGDSVDIPELYLK
jgi:hypothetical protein